MPIRTRTRFSADLKGQERARRGRTLAYAYGPAPPPIAAILGLSPGARVLMLETLSEAEGRPLARASNHFEGCRFDGLAKAFAETDSITAALERQGVTDYVRRSTQISAQHASAQDLHHLRLSPGAIVLVTVSINENFSGAAIQVAETHLNAALVDLIVAKDDVGGG